MAWTFEGYKCFKSLTFRWFNVPVRKMETQMDFHDKVARLPIWLKSRRKRWSATAPKFKRHTRAYPNCDFTGTLPRFININKTNPPTNPQKSNGKNSNVHQAWVRRRAYRMDSDSNFVPQNTEWDSELPHQNKTQQQDSDNDDEYESPYTMGFRELYDAVTAERASIRKIGLEWSTDNESDYSGQNRGWWDPDDHRNYHFQQFRDKSSWNWRWKQPLQQ